MSQTTQMSQITQLCNFQGLQEIIRSFQENSFLSLPVRKRFRKINQTLMQLIQSAPSPCFLLSAVLDFAHQINEAKLLSELYTLRQFEFWLNHFSELSYEENYKIRAKIVGKHVPREDFQSLFPIGMNKTYSGSHFVAAHLSPDVDTMIASFIGWMDAFAARVGTGLHQWLLPEGPPDSPITVILSEMFGLSLFQLLARSTPTLNLSAQDLLTQRNWIKASGHTLITTVHNDRQDKMITLVDKEGHYIGDWRNTDFEAVRQVVNLFKSPLRWLENNVHTKLVSLFSNSDLSIKDLSTFYSSIFNTCFEKCEPVLEYTKKQMSQLDSFFKNILHIEKGIKATLGDIIKTFENLQLTGVKEFKEQIESLPKSSLFDNNGRLTPDTSALFKWLENLLNILDKAMKHISLFLDRLDVVIAIKHKVLENTPVTLTLHSDVEEIRNKIENFDFLTVVIHEKDGSLFPVGIVYGSDLRKSGLGTVSLRDFCNLEEIKMAPYIEVISIVDHHKSTLKTLSVPCAIIGDAQSCNVLMAEQAFLINDRYSLGGMTLQQIDQQYQEILSKAKTASDLRILQRLIHRQQAAKNAAEYYIDPQREAAEYTYFLQAILDDTDLLSKVSDRDVACIVQLLNRLKSFYGPEREVITLDDIPKNKDFAKAAAKRILQNSEMYALYKKTFDFREKDISKNLELCHQNRPHSLFVDTKEQNGCARVGQTKIFHSNYPIFEKTAQGIRSVWYKEALQSNQAKPEIDLHIHMISTIPSADEVYHDQIVSYNHQDEIWFWIPSTQQARDHLAAFLTNFQTIARSFQKEMNVEFIGENANELESLFQHYFLPIPSKQAVKKNGLPIAILRFAPGKVNSRKAMITPCIPRCIV